MDQVNSNRANSNVKGGKLGMKIEHEWYLALGLMFSGIILFLITALLSLNSDISQSHMITVLIITTTLFIIGLVILKRPRGYPRRFGV